jgi:hypothetical protein
MAPATPPTNLNDYGVVGKNANSDYATGCGRGTTHSDNDSYAGGTTCTPTSDNVNRSYYTPLGLETSTTGTVYGVYDMVGGAYEHTVSNSNSTAGSSGFSTLPNGSYGVNYPFGGTNFTNFQQCTFATCGGQGLYETTFVTAVSNSNHSWSRDSSYFVRSSNPWALRGGRCVNSYGVGLFYSDYYSGGAYSYSGFRVGLGEF